MSEPLLTIDEVCDLLKVKKSYIYRLTSTNKIPYYKVGGLKFKLSDVERWLQRNKVSSGKAKSFEELIDGHRKPAKSSG